MRRPALALALLPLWCSDLACKGAEPPRSPCDAPVELDVVVDGGEGLNPGHHGEAWPTHVRLYQVSGAPDLATIDPLLLASDDAALGVDLLDRRERVLYPHSHERWSLTLLPETTHIAVAALFHRPEPESWGAAVPIPRPLEICPGDAAPPICVFITVEGSEVRGGATPPPAFVGDGRPCRRLSALSPAATTPAASPPSPAAPPQPALSAPEAPPLPTTYP